MVNIEAIKPALRNVTQGNGEAYFGGLSFRAKSSQQVIKIPIKGQNCKCLCHRLEKHHSIRAL